MKYTRYILPAVATAMLLISCDDQAWEWGKPEGEHPVTMSDIPLAVKEVVANYDGIKTYAQQYAPNMVIGLGFDAQQYIDNAEYGSGIKYADLTNENFQMVTPGNAMKMDAIVSASGALNFGRVDAMLDAMSENPDLRLYGHNFLWHTQQQQTYLKSLIAPTLVVETDSDIDPMFGGDSQDFEGGSTGAWGAWGNSSTKDVSKPGAEGSEYCMILVNPKDADPWSAQCAYTFEAPLNPDVEYTIRFKAKSSVGSGQLQFQYQNGSTYGSQGGYNTFNIGTSWNTYEYSFTPAYTDDNRIMFNFGAVAGTYYIDDVEFGTKIEDPMETVLAGDDADFDKGSTGAWGSWGNSSSKDVAAPGYKDSEYCMHLVNPKDADPWSAQCAYTFDAPLDNTKKYIIQFYAKSSSASGQIQFQYQNGATYGSQGGYNTFNVGKDWVLCEYAFTPAYDDANRIIFNFGAVGAEYYIDNVKFGIAKDQSAGSKSRQIIRKAGKHKAKSYYVMKSAAEKREALLGAMEAWISGMAKHLEEKGVKPYGYDVINEAIADGANAMRGINGVFGSSYEDGAGNTLYDKAPVEDVNDGLTLNWGGGHWYWGYYIGEDYAVKAYQMARKYLPAETKLFYNDYNLETVPAKRRAVIDFVKSIDDANGSPIVDGIGTQCHLRLDVSADESFDEQIEAFMLQVDASLTDLAATGKLVRITELDISLGTATPSSNQLEAQYEAYRRVFESYRRIVPEAQQSGITIWTLSDNADEHVYWLPNESPNLFDANGLRKWAYKGVCDGLAGQDLGIKYGGDDYKAYYEKKNTGNF